MLVEEATLLLYDYSLSPRAVSNFFLMALVQLLKYKGQGWTENLLLLLMMAKWAIS